MAFAPDKELFNAYRTTTAARPRSAAPTSDVYGVKNIAKTPSAAELAFNVMKKIHKAAGEECPDRGRSVYDNLAYMKTEPTVQLLANKTWRDFFTEYEHDGEKRERYIHEDEQPRHHRSYQEENEINYPKLFHKLVKRTYNLWKELHIPDSDRDFYSYALLQGPYRTPDQIDELACYVKKMKEHRASTVFVLSCIEEREKSVIRGTELIASAHRSIGMKFVSMHDELKKNTDREAGVEEDNRVAEEIRESLCRLRTASAEVVKAVQAWRRELWRPHPFIYRGQNYLVKMATDMDFIRSDSITRLLHALDIRDQELAGVVFDSPVEIGMSSAHQVASLSQQLEHMASSAEGASPGQPPSESGPDGESLRKGGLEGSAVFGNGSQVSDMDGLVTVVLEEETLQRALLLERKALMSRGAFIPLLKYELDNYSTSTVPESKQNSRK